MSKKNFISLFLCFILTLIVIFSIRGFKYLFHFRDDGSYDYNLAINKGYDWVGPRVGENIQLNYLADENNSLLSENSKNKLILLSVVDPECGACKFAQDQMQFLESNLKDKEIDYFIISFSSELTAVKPSRYVKSMKLSSQTFLWTNGDENIIPSINKMVIPSHILINSNGNVIKTFPGTNNEKFIRERMTNQILMETLIEKNKTN